MFFVHKISTPLCCIAVAVGVTGCSVLDKITGGPIEDPKSAGGSDVSSQTSMLLGMSYAEAAAISPKKMDVPPFFKVAADEIEVVRKNKDGSPRSVRAKGKVYLEIGFHEPAIALCQEAYFGDEEVILRGHPLLKRGTSVVEGLANSTVFYMFGLRLRVIGLHRVANEGQVMSSLPEDTKLGFRKSGGSWGAGPNPLLPPLSPSSVPENIRSEMQKAAEAEAVLQRSRMQPVLPLKEDAPAGKITPLVVPPEKKKPEEEGKKEPAKEPEKPAGQ